MSQPWWASALKWTIWGIIMAAVTGWIAKSRDRPRPRSEAHRLCHPQSTLIIGLVGFAFFFGVAVISNVYPDQTTTRLTTSGFLGFAALSLAVVAEYFLARHAISEQGMNYGRLAGKPGSLNWNDVVRVRYASMMKWFKVESKSGAVARISVMLVGLPEFARMVLAHAPRATTETDTLAVLESTAGGRPPSIWG